MIGKLLRKFRYLLVLGCLLTGLWTFVGHQPVHSSAIAPITVRASSNDTYEQLLARAKQDTLAEIARQFNGNAALASLEFEVLGKRSGSQVPLLRVSVRRSQWQQQPANIDAWIDVDPDSQALLGFSASRVGSTRTTAARDSSAIVRRSSASTPPQSRRSNSSSNSGLSAPLVAAAPSKLDRIPYDRDAGDFFDAISSEDGLYLRWVEYPITVYVENGNSDWGQSIEAAIDDWSQYIPLRKVRREEDANISIIRTAPIARVGGVATPSLFIDSEARRQMKVSIVITEFQTLGRVASTARHELGHALGLWGHSPNPRDLMYATELFPNPSVTRHAVNTLKRVYEQPTAIGQRVSLEDFSG
ncbi:hypothetical protein [Synechococcus sp. PCC 7336]|uniref:hypothetical protein n=1 Tax=Synechococcus sp. PCC 7336 TaxID=195250 RepID=UPI0003470AEE|nr:hypothetical protein [Synechococcus sp. PCC 7336]